MAVSEQLTAEQPAGLRQIAEAATPAGEAKGGMTTQAGVSERTARSVTRPVTINVRPEVAAFARAMEHKLAANDHKEHWREMRVHQLLEMLRDEVDELVRAVADFHGGMGPHRNVLDEAADVANFAMMVADVVALKPCEIGRMEATERE